MEASVPVTADVRQSGGKIQLLRIMDGFAGIPSVAATG
jgi:hypothetical protein